MEGFFDSNYYPKFGDITEDYWNDTGITRNLFFDEEDDVSADDDLFQTEIDTEPSKSVSNIPLQSLILKGNLDLVLEDSNREEFGIPQTIDECIDYLFVGRNCNLYGYKSFSQKTKLLEKALNTYDGNVIMTVILFLENTLNFNIFLQILLNKKLALDHYCYYLLCTRNIEKLHSVQMVASDYFDMMDIFYLCVRHNDTNEELKQKLKRHITECSGSTGFEKDILTNYKTFLDIEIVKKLHYKSVIEILAYKIKENLEKHGNIDSSETNDIKCSMKISEFQYDWVKFNVIASLTMWNKILEFCIYTNRFTRKKEIKSLLGKDLILMNLCKRDAPKHILEAILGAMPLDEFTLHWAQKTKCFKYIIEYHAAQKDRLALIQSKMMLMPGSEEFLYADTLLKSDKKWKN